MKIVSIFGKKLYACQYNGQAHNEYARLMDLWADAFYLRGYAQENNISDNNFIFDSDSFYELINEDYEDQ